MKDTYFSLLAKGLSPEQIIAKMLLGEGGASALKTDGYKFSMAQAGKPLCWEGFIFSLRKGGPYYIPFDTEKIIQALVPEMPGTKEQGFLQAHGYGMTPAMEVALNGPMKVWAAPKGSWVLGGEPVAVVSSPSFLASWPEPLVIMLNYPIQVATAIRAGEREFFAVCHDESVILEAVADIMGTPIKIIRRDEEYRSGVYQNAVDMVLAVQGDAGRIFEVGLRGATCMEQHLIALSEIRKTGINKTSNVWGAWQLYMIPVGTTGHEHQERWGSDEAGFLAISDMRPEPPSFLFDTYDPIRCGIPTALKILRANPHRACSFRFDSGDQDVQFLQILQGCISGDEKLDVTPGEEPGSYTLKLIPNLLFEDSYNPQKTVKNEAFCERWGWPREKRMYGPGGWFISVPHPTPYGRDRASAAYKLCWSNGARKKFSGTPGKGSICGRPCILRRVLGALPMDCEAYKIDSLIAQEGEQVFGYLPIGDSRCVDIPKTTALSPETQRLADLLLEAREAQIRLLEEENG